MRKKLSTYIIMLIIGFTLLILAITMEMPEPLKWVMIAAALVLNITSAVAAMRIGLQQMKPDKPDKH